MLGKYVRKNSTNFKEAFGSVEYYLANREETFIILSQAAIILT